MLEELGPQQSLLLSRRHRQLQATQLSEEDLIGRWSETADFASAVVSLWFEGRTLEEVLARAKSLGHMDGDMESGHLLEGKFIDDLAVAQDMSFDEVLPMVRELSPGRVSLFTTCPHNCFDLEPRRSHLVNKLRPTDGQGSLNTTWTFDSKGPSGIKLMDDLHEGMKDALDGCSAVRLNPRVYLIWKFQHYVTSYHQDVHVPPHITIYNQVSGVSLFHFLPLLVGLYVTHVGRRDVTKLESLLKELDDAGIGSLCTLGPGQVAMITPFGSHGVWVPAPSYNPELPHFSVSVIRAAELYVEPILRACRELHQHRRWNNVLEETHEARAEVKQFAAVQAGLCREMQLSRDDWFWLCRLTWSMWEAEAAEARHEVEDEDESEEASVESGNDETPVQSGSSA